MHNLETSQGVPRFVRFLASIYAKKDLAPTKMTHLAPIHRAVTEYWTLVEVFEISHKLAKQGNMRYTHSTLGVGAAIKVFHVVWNDKDQWSNIIIVIIIIIIIIIIITIIIILLFIRKMFYKIICNIDYLHLTNKNQ